MLQCKIFQNTLLLLMLILPAFLFAQSWTSQTIPSSSTLRSIHFIDANNGWAAGYDGVIYHTTNGGTNWSLQTSNVTERLLAIRFVSANYGWANAGLRVLRTEDGGANWHSMTGLDANAAIFRNVIFPVSSTVAWATAQASGQRWFYRYTATSSTAVTEQTFGLIGSSATLIDLWFIDSDNGWAVGTSGQIWKIGSASGGSPSFTNQTNTGVTSSTLRGIYMLDANNGWAVGDGGTIIKTTNGGTNWSAVSSGISTALRDVHLYDMNNAIVVGDGGVIRSTTDGGSNWTAHASGVSTVLWSVMFVNPSTGFVAGGDFSTSGNGVILSVSDFALPVELTSFTVTTKGKVVELAWETAIEANNFGFEIQRSEVKNQESANRRIGEWVKVGFIAGSGTTNSPKSYNFVDDAARGKVAYRLKQIDRDGKFSYSQEVMVATGSVPQEYALLQNYPNPFNPTTEIRYQMSEVGHASLRVYDMLGREVQTLVNEMKEVGEHTTEFNASNLPSGIYFYTLRANNFAQTKKLMLVK